jgi:putative hemolysin
MIPNDLFPTSVFRGRDLVHPWRRPDRPDAAFRNELERLQAGSLQLRLARSPAEIAAVQALRYHVFYETCGAQASRRVARLQRDIDRFDSFADLLMVVDRAYGRHAVVGTYRLLRRSVARRHGGFYTAGEYDISALEARPGAIMELGRSCVDAGYRGRPVLELLWRGIAAFVAQYRIALMFGCASLRGTDPQALAAPLSYLHHNHLAPADLRPRALDHRYLAMQRLPVDALEPPKARAALPPLLKGYLRLGGSVGDGAVIDHQFNTTDVCVVLPTERIAARYTRRFQRPAPLSRAA